jgi:isoleucyl-tRNA synthetase
MRSEKSGIALGRLSDSKTSLFPANMYLEGFDQHSRWFLSSVVLSMALKDEAPFKVLKTHGLLMDEEGNKISKSASTVQQEKPL